MWSYDDRRWLRVDVAFVILFSGLLAYNILAWQGRFGLGPQRPLPSISLSAGLLLSSLASVVRRRSRRLFYALIAMSGAAVAISFATL